MSVLIYTLQIYYIPDINKIVTEEVMVGKLIPLFHTNIFADNYIIIYSPDPSLSMV